MLITLRALLTLTSLAVVHGMSHAQSVYVDFAGPVPAPTYAAAASAPGVWNSLAVPGPLVGIYGQPIALEIIDPFGWCGEWNCPMTGDASALLGDFLLGDCFEARKLTIRNLEAGTYRVHVYAYGSLICAGHYNDFPVSFRISHPGGSGWTHVPAGPWTSPLTLNHLEVSYTHSGTNHIELAFTGEGESGLSAIQFEKVATEPVAFCFGTASTCPCGPGAAGHGCPSSHDLNGSRLVATGDTDVAADTFTLHATGVSN